MKITKKKVIYYYSWLNKNVFYNNLPPAKDIIFKFKPPKHNEIAYCTIYHFDKTIELGFRYKKYKSLKAFLEILVHEMCHIADFLENGYLTGHGKSFFKWKEKIKCQLKLDVHTVYTFENIIRK